MKITGADASRLARFLAKGIFENTANKDVDISIGDNAHIGILRRGHKYFLYIRYNDVILKSDIIGGFNENIEMDVLAENIKSLIENSTTIKDIVLNMEKVPLLPVETMETSENINTNVSEPIPTTSTEYTDATVTSETISTTPDVANDTTVIDPPVESNDTISDETNGSSEETEPNDEDNSIYEELGGQSVVPDDSEPESIDNDEESGLEEFRMDSTAMEIEGTKIETSIGVKGMMPAKVDNKKLPEMSYLANVIGNEAEIKQKLTKAIEQIVSRDKESAVEFYIRILYRMLPLFNNDISSASTGTGLDERDFMLSVYERALFEK